MTDPICTKPQVGDHIITLNWNLKVNQQIMDLNGIEILCKFILQDKEHDKDFLFFPLINLIKSYLQQPLNIDIPEELEQEIEWIKRIIEKIEKLYAAKERIDIDFIKFNQLVELIIAKIEGLTSMAEEMPFYE